MYKIDLPVEEYTTPNPITASETTSLEELAQLMNQHKVRHIPILKGETVIGIVSDRDCRLAAGLTKNEKLMIRASDIMAPNPVTVSAGESLDDVAFEMAESKIGSVIVNDENDKFLGIFTATDALNALIEILRQGRA